MSCRWPVTILRHPIPSDDFARTSVGRYRRKWLNPAQSSLESQDNEFGMVLYVVVVVPSPSRDSDKALITACSADSCPETNWCSNIGTWVLLIICAFAHCLTAEDSSIKSTNKPGGGGSSGQVEVGGHARIKGRTRGSRKMRIFETMWYDRCCGTS
jgi:hypothetical protein